MNHICIKNASEDHDRENLSCGETVAPGRETVCGGGCHPSPRLQRPPSGLLITDCHDPRNHPFRTRQPPTRSAELIMRSGWWNLCHVTIKSRLSVWVYMCAWFGYRAGGIWNSPVGLIILMQSNLPHCNQTVKYIRMTRYELEIFFVSKQNDNLIVWAFRKKPRIRGWQSYHSCPI